MTRQRFQDLTRNNGVRGESQERNLRSYLHTYTWITSSVIGMELPAKLCSAIPEEQQTPVGLQPNFPAPDRCARQTMGSKPTLEHFFLHSQAQVLLRWEPLWHSESFEGASSPISTLDKASHRELRLVNKASFGERQQTHRCGIVNCLPFPTVPYSLHTCQPRTCLMYNSDVCSIHKRALAVRRPCWNFFRES